MRNALARLRPSLSVLRSPLAKAEEFYIELDEPHKVWTPGDNITGMVVLDIRKPVRTLSVRLRLTGQLVIRNAVVKGTSFRHVLCQDEIILWESGQQGDETETDGSAKLARGEHSFAFMFELPQKGLMTSLEFEKGAITYILTASHHKPGLLPPSVCHKQISMLCRLDVTDLPPPKPSMVSVEIKKKSRKKEKGTATVIVETPSVGCLRGEVIPVKITVRHVFEVGNINGVVITFLRISRVCADELEPLSFRKDLVQTVVPLYIDRRSLTTIINTNIQVPPDIFPTIDEYPLIAFKYCLEVVLDLSGKAVLPLAQTASPTDIERQKTAVDTSSKPYVDTELLKRTKGVVSLWTEIVVGTEKSEAVVARPTNTPSNANKGEISEYVPTQSGSISTSVEAVSSTNQAHTEEPEASSSTVPLTRPYSHTSIEASSSSNFQTAVPSVPLMEARYISSNISDNFHNMSEKERMATFEASVLPSAPPELPLPSLSTTAVPSLDEIGQVEGMFSAINISSQIMPPTSLYTEPESIVASSSRDDKLERERERLRELASAPSMDHIHSYQPVPCYDHATAPDIGDIDPYAVIDQMPSRQCDEGAVEDDDAVEEADWVPVYSENAQEESVSMGGHAYLYDFHPPP
ncbi:hypothetical protein V1511DRAFT_496213 [Dipodascopsis uninucleata]